MVAGRSNVGDWVSLHWEWVCDRLTEQQVGLPARRTRCATCRSSTRATFTPVRPGCSTAEPRRPGLRSGHDSLQRPAHLLAAGVARRARLADQQPALVGLQQVVRVRPPEPHVGHSARCGRPSEVAPTPGRTRSGPAGAGEHGRRAGEPGGPQRPRAGGRPPRACPTWTTLPVRRAAPPGRRRRAPPRRRGWRTWRPPRCRAAG